MRTQGKHGARPDCRAADAGRRQKGVVKVPADEHLWGMPPRFPPGPPDDPTFATPPRA